MKTEKEVREGMETWKDFLKEDIGFLSKQVARQDYVTASKTLNQIQITLIALIAAEEVLAP